MQVHGQTDACTCTDSIWLDKILAVWVISVDTAGALSAGSLQWEREKKEQRKIESNR